MIKEQEYYKWRAKQRLVRIKALKKKVEKMAAAIEELAASIDLAIQIEEWEKMNYDR